MYRAFGGLALDFENIPMLRDVVASMCLVGLKGDLTSFRHFGGWSVISDRPSARQVWYFRFQDTSTLDLLGVQKLDLQFPELFFQVPAETTKTTSYCLQMYLWAFEYAHAFSLPLLFDGFCSRFFEKLRSCLKNFIQWKLRKSLKLTT